MIKSIDTIAENASSQSQTGFSGNFRKEPMNVGYATADDRHLALAYLNAMEQIAFLQQQLQTTQKQGVQKDFTGTLKSILTQKLMKENKELEHLAMTDPLTSIPSRRNLKDKMVPQAYSRAGRDHSDIYFVMFDLDHFKKINDTYGHQIGDETLKSFGEYLMKHTREHERPARYGGEEFAWVVNGKDYASFVRRVEKIREGASNYLTQTLKNLTGKEDAKVTVSAGVASAKYSSINKENLLSDHITLIDFADSALYRSKETTRNSTHVFYNGKPMHSMDFEASTLTLPEAIYRQ